MKNRLYFSKEKPKVEISYVSIIQSWKEILSYSKKNADSDFLMFTLMQLLQLNLNYSQHTLVKTFRQSLSGNKAE